MSLHARACPGYVLAAVQFDLSGMAAAAAAAGHIEISHMCCQLYDWRKSPECPRRGDEGGRRTAEFLLFIHDLWRAAVQYTAVRVTRGSILLL